MTTEWNYWDDLPPEKEEELINKIADFFVRKGLGLFALMALESGGTLTRMFAEFWMGLYGPYIEFLGADEYTALLRKRGNTDKLIARIEELEEKKKKMKKKD
jgi:hypothetical protein